MGLFIIIIIITIIIIIKSCEIVSAHRSAILAIGAQLAVLGTTGIVTHTVSGVYACVGANLQVEEG